MSGLEHETQTGRPRGRPAQRTRGRGVTRDTIIEAATKEFAELGYEGATTASIARRVRVTQPLIHYHFGSKEALWHATVDSIFGKLMQQRGASLLNALVIGVALSLPAGGYALLANLQGAAQRFTVEP